MIHMILVDLDTGVKVEARGVDDVAAKMRKSSAMYDALRTAFDDAKKSGNDLDKVARADRTIGPIQGYQVKRNKQVDVPTEAWQKSVERRLDGYEDLLKDLGTFIYENNLTADEAREFLNNRFMR